MAYRAEDNGDIVINGFENGIGASPYSGLTDLKSVNISSIPGEVSVNFSTALISPNAFTGTVGVLSSNATNNTITFQNGTGLVRGQAISFVSSTVGGTSTTPTVYWLGNVTGGNTAQLYDNYINTNVVDITSDGGTGVFTVYNVATPKFFTSDSSGYYYMVDSLGQVWSNQTYTLYNGWTFTGNTKHITGDNSYGNGLVYYESSNRTGYLFVFSESSIDYTKTASSDFGWVYGWKPVDGSLGNAAPYLNSPVNKGLNSLLTYHYAILAPESTVFYGDLSNVSSFYQGGSTPFDPATKSTYVWGTFSILPANDYVQCLAPLGTSLLIGGIHNCVYMWDTVAATFNYVILLAESYVSQIVTVNTNAYLFVGNRGNIYITNGSQAMPFVKVPDHISNTVEPYFKWGGATYQKNKLYFGIYATNNSNTAIDGYAGLWCVDISTKAIHLSNQLSFGSYGNGGYATALISIPATSAFGGQPGIGLYIGWATTIQTGIDATISTPYNTGGQPYIISDMIPIGTLLKPTTVAGLEFKLATPLLQGERVELQIASMLGGTFTSALIVNGDGSLISGNTNNSQGITVQEQQWILIKAILTGLASNPSYNRLTELRIIRN